MRRCLRDRALWLMAEGEGSGEDWEHVAACAACAAQYERLQGDLDALRSTLTGVPAPQAISPHLRLGYRHWAMAAAACAVIVVMVWSTVWWRGPAPLVLSREGGYESVWLFLEEVSIALFATVDVGAAGIPAGVVDAADLQAALDGDWPCEGYAPFFDAACDDQPFTLLLGGW